MPELRTPADCYSNQTQANRQKPTFFMAAGFKSVLNKLLNRHQYLLLPPDDFLLRLRCSVIGEGMLHPGNIYLMDQAIRHMPDGGCVLEIGSYGGLSANLMSYLLQKHQRSAPLFCCDAWVYEGFYDANGRITPWMDGRDDVLRTDYMAYIKTAFMQAARLLNPARLPHAIHLDSDTFFDGWAEKKKLKDVFERETTLGGPIAFAYVDGNHAYAYAKRDVEHVAKHLLPGGYLLLDDSARHQTFGSVRVARELCRHPEFEVVRANPHYLFRKKG